MLVILISLRHRPDFVAAIIDPAALCRFAAGREVLSLVLRIDKQIGVTRKGDLHHASAELRHDRDSHPRIAQLFRTPSLKVRRFDAASRRILCSRPRLPGDESGTKHRGDEREGAQWHEKMPCGPPHDKNIKHFRECFYTTARFQYPAQIPNIKSNQ